MTEQQNKEANASHRFAAALADAQGIIEAAQQRAAEIIEEAARSLESERERGYREGLEQGRRDGCEKAVRLVEDVGQLGELLATEAAKLAVAIAGEVVNEQIKVEPMMVKNIAVEALKEAVIGDNVTLLLNPEDEELLQDHLGFLQRVARGAKITLEKDATISRGGCLVRTDFGEVDATLETLLQSVSERLGVIE